MADGIILSSNSTMAPLAADGEWSGPAQNVSRFNSVTMAGLIDQDCTVRMEFSVDGTNWDSSVPFPIKANQGFFHRLTVLRSFFRCRITNGPVAQSILRVQCLAGSKSLLTSGLNGSVSKNADAIVAKTVSDGLTIPAGMINGWESGTKFGVNDDIDTAAEDVWHGGGDYTGFPLGAAETIEVFSDDATDTSAGTGARTVRLIGLDADYVEQTEDVTLNGTSPVATTNTWLRMSRMFVLTAGADAMNNGTITARHTTTTANVFAAMPPGDDQTLICATTVPAGKNMIIRRVSAQLGRNSASGSADISLRARELGSVFRKRRRYTASVGDGFDRHYEGGLVLPEKTDVKMRVEGNTANNTSVAGEFEYYLVET